MKNILHDITRSIDLAPAVKKYTPSILFRYCLDTVSILHVAFRYSTEYFPRACFENILRVVSLLRPRSKIYSQDASECFLDTLDTTRIIPFALAFKNILPGYFLDTFWILLRYYTQYFAPTFKNILPGYFLDTSWILFRYYTQHRFCIRFGCDCAEFWCVPAFSEGWNIEFTVFQPFGRLEH